MLLTIVAFFFVLSIVVFVHEFGHFFVAKLNRIFVLTFSFGFGPKLLRKKIGETEYAVSAFPFGGYVKFAGESAEDDAEDKHHDEHEIDIPEHMLYRNKSPLQKMSVVVAGPFMNMLFTILVYIFSLWIQGVYVINPSRTISDVMENSPAARAGFRPGDKILRINEEPLDYWEDIERLAVFEEGVISSFAVLRGEDTLVIEAAPELDPETGLWKFGIYRLRPPKIGDVKRGSPADKAGIRSGAVILTINDTTITQFDDLQRIIQPNLGVAMKFTWELDGELYSAMITPVSTDAAVEGERLDVVKVGSIGIGEFYEERRISFLDSVRYGTRAFTDLLVYIIEFLGKLITGKATIRAVGGPLRVGLMAGDMLRWGFNYLVSFLAFFSLNLAIFNLLPILPFDGGHFVLYFTELVSGRKINRKIQHAMMQVGFVVLVALMIFILFIDVLNIFR